MNRRLIVNADDFGWSSSINEAVLQAHVSGILTSASLMVSGDQFAQAVRLASQHPHLGVGLHLTLVCGTPAAPPSAIPGLLASNGAFSSNPVWAGFRYFFHPALRTQIEKEISAQFERFLQTGLTLDHVNGHLNIHLHPLILRILLDHAPRFHLRAIRLTRDPFFFNLGLARGNWAYRASHALIYNLLSRWAENQLRRHRIYFTRRVFGLLQSGRVHLDYLLGLLRNLPEGDSELYSHPSLDQFKPELDALLSPQVRCLLQKRKVQLARYQDLIEL
jgi:chitin disaccharide deacetylase